MFYLTEKDSPRIKSDFLLVVKLQDATCIIYQEQNTQVVMSLTWKK